MITRILSAVVLAPLLLYLVIQGTSLAFFLLMLPVSAGLLYEWLNLQGVVSWKEWGLLVGLAWIFLLGQFLGWEQAALSLVAIALFLMISLSVLNYRPGQSVVPLWSRDFTGLIYCTLPLVLLLDIQQHRGGAFVLFPLLIIWATDSIAYFSGKFFGRRKLAPLLSPGKTWAGFYGGCLGGLLAALSVHSLFGMAFSYGHAVVLGLLLSLSGQLGDLAESLLKREAGVKDSGRLIPGHGGLLDRLDSLLFAVPVYYLFLLWADITLHIQGESLAG